MKMAKSLLAVLAVLMMLLSLCACGDNKAATDESTEKEATGNNDDKTGDNTGGEEEAPEGSEYVFELVGAELFKDGDDEDAIRIYYDFTNNSKVTKSAFMACSLKAKQDGVELQWTYAPYGEDVVASSFDGMGVRPGVTVRCADEYKVDPAGGLVTLTVSRGFLDENPLTFELDPTNLTAPAGDFEIATIADPAWTDSLEDRGTIDDQYEVFIDNAEVTTDWDDNELIRVYLEFTNNSDKAQSFYMACSTFAYQDGVQLEADYASDKVDEDDNYSLEIDPGKTIRVTRCFRLRSNSEVEVEVADSMGASVIGTSYVIEG